MEININRIKTDIENLSRFNATPEKGCTRFSYSQEDRQARDYLMEEMRKAGLKITVDAIGNIRARLEGKEPEAPPILTGSHIDTVPHGGNFDGAMGVAVGLEVLRTIAENNIIHVNPIELIVFVEEEGCNFGTPMAGSKVLTGKLDRSALLKLINRQGISLYDTARDFGLNPDFLQNYIIKPGDIKAMIEIHVEQSVVLENKGVSIGIVERIAGIKRLEIIFQGESNHAGATPMYLRKDPMAAAAKIIAAMDEIVREKAFSTTVATVGKINCFPNAVNVIPEEVRFTVDIRDVNPRGIEIIEREINQMVNKVTQNYGVQSNIEPSGEAPAIELSQRIVEMIEVSAKIEGIQQIRMNSGASHDACILADITDVGLIFVPSIGGRSHVPEESTKFEDIRKGGQILLNTIIQLGN